MKVKNVELAGAAGATFVAAAYLLKGMALIEPAVWHAMNAAGALLFFWYGVTRQLWLIEVFGFSILGVSGYFIYLALFP